MILASGDAITSRPADIHSIDLSFYFLQENVAYVPILKNKA